MRERAAEQGGTFRIESEPGRGTMVEIALPTENTVTESADA